jgi:putative FmdB family regulatory protein
MPTYEYECDACGNRFEKFQSITAAPIKKCPECGKAKVRRLIGTGAGLLFKGSGFYITDYRPDSYNQAAKADGPASSNGEAKSDTKGSDAKPDAKPAETAAKKADAPAAAAAAPAPKKESPKPAAKESKSTKKS